MNKRTRRLKHQKDLMHEAKGYTLRHNSRIKRGEAKKPAQSIHFHCGCGSSGCCGLYHVDKVAPKTRSSHESV